MTYEEQKAKELIDYFQSQIGWRNIDANFCSTLVNNELEVKIKEIARDFRHKAAENVLAVKGDLIDSNGLVNQCHSAVMNTNL